MKLRQTSASLRAKRQKTKEHEPLAETVIPLNKHGQRDWESMSDDKICAYAKKFIAEKGIKNRRELQKADGGLHEVLGRRKLLDRIIFEKKMRSWTSMSDAEIVRHAKRFIEDNGIRYKKQLESMDSGLYQILKKRKLINSVWLGKKINRWATISDHKLLAFAQELIEKEEIKNRAIFQKRHGSLYFTLWKRNLSAKLRFQADERKWSTYNDEELADYAKNFLQINRIKTRSVLRKEDNGLYSVLWQRKLLDHVFTDINRDRLRVGIGEIIEALAEFRGEAA